MVSGDHLLPTGGQCLRQRLDRERRTEAYCDRLKGSLTVSVWFW